MEKEFSWQLSDIQRSNHLIWYANVVAQEILQKLLVINYMKGKKKLVCKISHIVQKYKLFSECSRMQFP